MITININNASTEKVAELKKYLKSQSWNFKSNQPIAESSFELSENSINGVVIKDDKMHEFYIIEREVAIDIIFSLFASATTKKNKPAQETT